MANGLLDSGTLETKALDTSGVAGGSMTNEGVASGTTLTGAAVADPLKLPDFGTVKDVQGYKAAQGTSGVATGIGYEATPYQVAPAGLVQERLKGIIDENSPLMKQSEMLSNQQMNARGLLNSSIANTAGQQAVIASAAPIAGADAASINAAMTNTANAQNAASQFGANAANVASSTNAQLLSAMNLANANSQNAALNLQAQAENARALAVLDNNSKQALAVLQAQNQQLLQASTSASSMFNQTVTNIANIQTNATLSEAQKNAAINSQLNMLNEGMRGVETVATTEQGAIDSLNLSTLFGGGQANVGGTAAPLVKITTPAQGAKQALDLRSQGQDLYNEYTQLMATKVPTQRGGKAINDAIQEKATPLRAQALILFKKADDAMIEGMRLDTPARLAANIAGYQKQLNISQAALANAQKTPYIFKPNPNIFGLPIQLPNPAIARYGANLARYTSIVNRLKAPR